MIDWGIKGLGGLFGLAAHAAGAAVGWAWDKVTGGIYSWLANGLALLIEWVWRVLDHASTPRVTADWFQNGVARQVGLLALAVTVAMMLASAMQAALAGRPEQIGDAVKHGVHAVAASALSITLVDVLLRLVDEASAGVWRQGRADLVRMLERMVTVATVTDTLGKTFVGPLCLILGFVGLIGLVVSLMMRSVLIYLVAALAPLVWSSSVLPSFRPSARRMVHLGVSLIVSKLAIVITLVIAVKLMAHAGSDSPGSGPAGSAVSAIGDLIPGFACFIIAAITPIVLYKLMPTVEGAVASSGVVGGWGRSVTTAAHTAVMARGLGAPAAASAATRTVAGQSGAVGKAGAAGVGGSTGTSSGGFGSRAITVPRPQQTEGSNQPSTEATGETGSTESSPGDPSAPTASPASAPAPGDRGGAAEQRRHVARPGDGSDGDRSR